MFSFAAKGVPLCLPKTNWKHPAVIQNQAKDLVLPMEIEHGQHIPGDGNDAVHRPAPVRPWKRTTSTYAQVGSSWTTKASSRVLLVCKTPGVIGNDSLSNLVQPGNESVAGAVDGDVEGKVILVAADKVQLRRFDPVRVELRDDPSDVQPL